VPYYGKGVGYHVEMPSKYAELAEKQAQEILGFVEKRCQQADVRYAKTELTRDVPYEAAIIDAATRRKCDLSFMASHGRRGISARLLGSETQGPDALEKSGTRLPPRRSDALGTLRRRTSSNIRQLAPQRCGASSGMLTSAKPALSNPSLIACAVATASALSPCTQILCGLTGMRLPVIEINALSSTMRMT